MNTNESKKEIFRNKKYLVEFMLAYVDHFCIVKIALSLVK